MHECFYDPVKISNWSKSIERFSIYLGLFFKV